MEYLQLLAILQHVAVGGTALAGFAYLFLGSDSFGTFMRHELKDWKIRTTLVWVTGSFALGYLMEDLAKNLIDADKPLLQINNVIIDKLIAENCVQPFFQPDRFERANTLLEISSSSPGTITIKQASLLARMREVKVAGQFPEGAELIVANKFLSDPRLPPIPKPEQVKHADLPTAKMRESDFTGDFEDEINELYYQAVNHVLETETYAGMLARIQDRQSFFRALGFLAEIFFILYAFWAIAYPVPRRLILDLALIASAVVFGYILSRRSIYNLFTWHLDHQTCVRLLTVVLFTMLAIVFRLPAVNVIVGYFLNRSFPWMFTQIIPHTEGKKVDEKWVEQPQPDVVVKYFDEQIEAWLPPTGSKLRRLLAQIDKLLKQDKGEKAKTTEQNKPSTQDKENDSKLERKKFWGYFNRQQKARSQSLAWIALLSLLVLGICTIGAHSESLEYDRRVFGYYAALLSRPDAKMAKREENPKDTTKDSSAPEKLSQ
jgi:hypothetical protein